MIRSLRRKFIAMTMAVFLAMLCVIFGLVIHFTGENLEAESIRTLRQAAAEPLQPGIPGQLRQPCFIIRATPWGQSVVTTGGFDLSDEAMLTEIVTQAAASRTEIGTVEGYDLRYCRIQRHNELTLVFVDISGEKAAMQNLKLTCAAIGVVSMALFWGVSILLARWAVRPVARAWEEQRQFVADASHELKTPLTVILTNAELLQEPGYDEASRGQFAGSILTMSYQMRGLVESLLQLARADSGQSKQEVAPLDYSKLVEDALLPFEPLYFEQGLMLESAVEPGIHLTGTARTLSQVVDILLDNGLKYAAPGGTVRLDLRSQGRNQCLLRVSSPGAALTAKQCKDIFRRFYRVDEARSMNHSYGLGLAIAQRIVNDHRGKIWAESKEGVNTFFVSLPVA